jgi:hypothetical protein
MFDSPLSMILGLIVGLAMLMFAIFVILVFFVPWFQAFTESLDAALVITRRHLLVLGDLGIRVGLDPTAIGG